MKQAASRCIALVGFRASGKSTLGARLAATLKRPFFDLDREIELAQGRTLRGLFENDGEPAFRQIEAETLEGILARPGIVFAPGGGAVLRDESRRLLRERACVLFLDVTWEILVQRMSASGPRPRLTTLPFEEEVRTLVAQRRPLYVECADHVVAVGADESVATTESRLHSLLTSS